MPPRIKISQSAMNKAGAYGLHMSGGKLSYLLKMMARLSAVASSNYNKQRRRYGSFILTMRDNTMVDINCNDDSYCIWCYGTEIDEVGEDCPCIDDVTTPDPSETVGGNHW